MAVEIERKFLVKGDYKIHSYAHESIIQGYLSSVAERTVRIRIRGNRAYLTVKGKTNDSGISRYEWEKEIYVSDAQELLLLCEEGVIEKVRYYVRCDNYKFEVDEFSGANAGLVVAEIELDSEDAWFDRPDWLGEEVTGDKRYYNAALSAKPYSQW